MTVLTEPVQSLREWEEDPEGNTFDVAGRTTRTWVRDKDEHAVKGMFKRPGPQAEPGEIYSMGMERVAYALGDALDLPIPATYLDDFDGRSGSVQRRVANARDWRQAPSCPMLMSVIENEDEVALSVVFDVWIANQDRVARNLMAEPLPPGVRPGHATRCRCWLVDSGCSGLWFPSKFLGRRGRTAEVAVGDGSMLGPFEARARRDMPERYRAAFTARGDAERAALVARVGNLSDDRIEKAVGEVPAGYMNQQEKDLTAELLKERRDRLDTLCELPW